MCLKEKQSFLDENIPQYSEQKADLLKCSEYFENLRDVVYKVKICAPDQIWTKLYSNIEHIQEDVSERMIISINICYLF